MLLFIVVPIFWTKEQEQYLLFLCHFIADCWVLAQDCINPRMQPDILAVVFSCKHRFLWDVYLLAILF